MTYLNFGKTVSALLALGLFAAPALAAHPDSRSEIEDLKQRIAALEATSSHDHDDHAAIEDEEAFTLARLGKHLTFAGALEVEGSYAKTKGEGSNSDLLLATAELSTEVTINDAVGGHVVLLYEQEPDDDNLKVDEAVLSLRHPGALAGTRVSLHAGRQYLPFGNFNSFMVSDPYTVDIGETRATAARLELEHDFLTLSGGVFNGTVDAGRDTIDSLFVAVELNPFDDALVFGASWISDMAESGADLVADASLYNGSVAGGSAFASLAVGPLALEAEVLTALRDFDAALVGIDTSVPADGIADTEMTGKRPRAWNLEAALTPIESLQFAGRYEELRDFAGDARRYGGTVSWEMLASTVLAAEYLYTNTDSAAADSQTVTAKLSMEF